MARKLSLRLDAIVYQAKSINRYDFVDPGGAPLPAFEAGAHVDVHLDNGLIRQYSLCSDPYDLRRYSVAVLAEADGRGGSMFLHETWRVGQIVRISEPRNNFRLAEPPGRSLFIAGGIGITPIMSMLAELRHRRGEFELHYCTRSPAATAFKDELLQAHEGRVSLHHDDGVMQGIDLQAVLRDVGNYDHLYYCGPPGFMKAIEAASAHWPEDACHFERFSGSPGPSPAAGDSFKIRILGSGEEFNIPADKSIVQVLTENGIAVETSCCEGYCGTCLTRYVEGEPEHRDEVLDAKTREKFVLICCARSRSPVLVLDIE
ncbi:MAG: PDR/VanB family oxidoreductase [Pusillimonas sp.]